MFCAKYSAWEDFSDLKSPSSAAFSRKASTAAIKNQILPVDLSIIELNPKVAEYENPICLLWESGYQRVGLSDSKQGHHQDLE